MSNFVTPETFRFCNDSVPLNVGPNFKSVNQNLVGKANPKTLIPPVIVPPSHDLTYWRENPFVIQSGINSETPTYNLESGYATRPCKTACDKDVYSLPPPPPPSELFRNPSLCRENGLQSSTIGETIVDVKEDYKPVQSYCKSGIESKSCQGNQFHPQDKQGIQVQTQSLDPTIAQWSNDPTPVNANIGISMTPQSQNIYSTTNTNGDQTYLASYDLPKLTEGKPGPPCPNTSNVYDPRFTGYGDNERYYLDPVLQQPRYFYGDVDAVKMPNYITRSKIDMYRFADQYGPLNDFNRNGNINTAEMHSWADNTFRSDTQNFRNEMMESMMQKQNRILAQRRKDPINTMATNNRRIF